MSETHASGLSPEIRHCRTLPASRRDACWLELLAVSAFMGGLNYAVIDAKWDGTSEFFHEFDPEHVAAMTPEDVERGMSDPRLIHNRRKIQAVVTNARTMLDLRREHGGFAEWLDTMPDAETRIHGLRKRFLFMGPTTARLFLHYAGEPTPGPCEAAPVHPMSRGRAKPAG